MKLCHPCSQLVIEGECRRYHFYIPEPTPPPKIRKKRVEEPSNTRFKDLIEKHAKLISLIK